MYGTWVCHMRAGEHSVDGTDHFVMVIAKATNGFAKSMIGSAMNKAKRAASTAKRAAITAKNLVRDVVTDAYGGMVQAVRMFREELFVMRRAYAEARQLRLEAAPWESM